MTTITDNMLASASSHQLVAWYNDFATALNESKVAKFADKQTAFKRILQIQERAKKAGKTVELTMEVTVTKAQLKKAATSEKAPAKAKAKAPAKKAAAKAPAKKPAAKKDGKATHEQRSASIAKSWKDPKVKEARAARHGVKVNGKEFKSVREAFDALGLPMGQHIGFRMKLKKAKLGTVIKEYGMNWTMYEL